MTQLEANRANARQSTGPRSAAGKSRSARNAVSHGLRSSDVVLPHENPKEFDRLLAHYRAQVDLSNPEQSFLAEEIAHAQWRLRRAQRLTRLYHTLEIEGFSKEPTPDEIIVRNMEQRGDNVPATLHRHETSFQRLWWRIQRKLQTLTEQRAERDYMDFERRMNEEDRRLRAHLLGHEPAEAEGREEPEANATEPMTLEELAEQLPLEECKDLLEALEQVRIRQINPMAWCNTRVEAWLDSLSDSQVAGFTASLQTRIAQTKPLAMAA